MSPTSRRSLMKRLATVTSALAFAGSLAAPALAQNTTVPVDQLMAEQPLPDIVQGKADAPVTIVEYASMTCPHCAHFHETVYPTIIKNYVDTGKAKFILREFPLDPLATAGFMLARCEGEKRPAVVDLLFSSQKNWAFNDKPLEGLSETLKQTGMSKDAFEACLKDQKTYDKVMAERDNASQKFNVTATPTFFVNGTKVTGELTVENFQKILDPLVAKKS